MPRKAISVSIRILAGVRWIQIADGAQLPLELSTELREIHSAQRAFTIKNQLKLKAIWALKQGE